MDTLYALLMLAIEHPPSPEVMGPPAPVGFLEQFSALEYTLFTSNAGLVGTVGVLFRWANSIRDKNGKKFDKIEEARAKETKAVITALVESTAEMKNLVKAVERLEQKRG